MMEITEAQKVALERLRQNWASVDWEEPMLIDGLPEGYITFTATGSDRNTMYGGISPEGTIST